MLCELVGQNDETQDLIKPLIKLLLSHGANPRKRHVQRGETPLDMAEMNNYPSEIMTPLVSAAQNFAVEVEDNLWDDPERLQHALDNHFYNAPSIPPNLQVGKFNYVSRFKQFNN